MAAVRVLHRHISVLDSSRTVPWVAHPTRIPDFSPVARDSCEMTTGYLQPLLLVVVARDSRELTTGYLQPLLLLVVVTEVL